MRDVVHAWEYLSGESNAFRTGVKSESVVIRARLESIPCASLVARRNARPSVSRLVKTAAQNSRCRVGWLPHIRCAREKTMRPALTRRGFFRFCLLALCVPVGAATCLGTPRASEGQKPKVRAITAFVRIDPATYQSQIADALKMLRAAKAAIERGGYDVQTIRIVTQPFPDYTRGLSRPAALAFLQKIDELAVRESFAPNIGPAMMRDADDPAAMDLLGDVLCATKELNASAIIAAADGIHWRTVRAAASLVKHVSACSPRSQANFNFAVTAMLGPYAPFYPGAYHTGTGHQFAIGLESANIVDEVFTAAGNNPSAAATQLTTALAHHAQAVERIAMQVAKETGWTYLGLDPTPAPLKDVSIGAAIEKFTGAPFGSSGTMTAASVITQAVKAVGVKHIGYSGLMLPVLEDARIAQRWGEGTVTVDALLAYSAVCATGLDTVPLPGDITEDQLARILADVASLAVKWHKPLAARLLPVAGKKAGDRTDFDDPFLVNTTLQKLP